MEDKLDTVLAADRIKKLQGKEVTEKPLDYWSDKKKEDEDIEEKEALIQKYVTTPKPAPVPQTKDSGLSRGRLSLLIFVVAAFFVGTGYGVYVISMPANNSAVAMTVNDSAFPANNTTANQTNTTTAKTTTAVTKTNSTTPSTTSTTTSTKTSTSNSNSSNTKKKSTTTTGNNTSSG
ncbi:MAG: hypothetical protein WAK14_08870 [Methanobacterium sp.]